MTTPRSSEIRVGLRTVLAGTDGLPDLLAAEGWKFDDLNVKQSYVADQFKPATDRPLELGAYVGSGATRLAGLSQATVFVPVGVGNTDLDLLMDAIAATFRASTPIVTATQRITVEYAQRGGASRQRDFNAATVTVSWHSDLI